MLFDIFSLALLTYINDTSNITSYHNITIPATYTTWDPVASSPAFQVDSNNKTSGVTVSWLWTVKNSYAYIVIYATSTQYSNYFPVVHSMINSFMLSASAYADNITSNSTTF